MKNKIIQGVIASLIGLVIAIAVYFIQTSTDTLDVLVAVSNGAFVSGIFIAGIGLLVVISGDGLFDILAFGAKNLIYLFTPKKLKSDRESYYEYSARRKEERKNNNPWIIVIIGGIYIAISLILLAIYSNTL